ncbi:MAG: ABC transporter ATP-binding protein [Spirochaetaceae bacterium]
MARLRTTAAAEHAELKDITVRFPENGVTANDMAGITIRRGEVHAIVGENGSGKSTLMHVLSGYIAGYSGEIRISGSIADIRSPRQALEYGTGMVHQHPRLIRQLRVWENVVLGSEPKKRWARISENAALRELRKLSETYGLEIDPLRYAGELSAEGMRNAALLTVLYHKAELIILDEPTTAVHEGAGSTASLIEGLIEGDKTVVLITHKLQDALTAADRITVMRNGRVITTGAASDFTAASLSTLMIGEEYVPYRKYHAEDNGQRPVGLQPAGPGDSRSPGGKVLEMENVSCSEGGFPPIKEFSLTVREGETIAVTGIRENGLETLEHILAGLTSPDSGTIKYLGEEIKSFSTSMIRKSKIAYIPTERLLRGASMESSVAENMILLNYRSFHSWGRLKRDEIEHYTGRLSREYGIKGSPGQSLSGLSGGNIQKVIISRELERLPKLIIFSEPSWGLDTRSRDFVFEKMRTLAREGSAVLILTSDLDEALEAGDSIIALYAGTSVGRIERKDAAKSILGRMVLGVTTEYPQTHAAQKAARWAVHRAAQRGETKKK